MTENSKKEENDLKKKKKLNEKKIGQFNNLESSFSLEQKALLFLVMHRGSAYSCVNKTINDHLFPEKTFNQSQQPRVSRIVNNLKRKGLIKLVNYCPNCRIPFTRIPSFCRNCGHLILQYDNSRDEGNMKTWPKYIIEPSIRGEKLINDYYLLALKKSVYYIEEKIRTLLTDIIKKVIKIDDLMESVNEEEFYEFNIENSNNIMKAIDSLPEQVEILRHLNPDLLSEFSEIPFMEEVNFDNVVDVSLKLQVIREYYWNFMLNHSEKLKKEVLALLKNKINRKIT